jgi:hypothetical protein
MSEFAGARPVPRGTENSSGTISLTFCRPYLCSDGHHPRFGPSLKCRSSVDLVPIGSSDPKPAVSSCIQTCEPFASWTPVTEVELVDNGLNLHVLLLGTVRFAAPAAAGSFKTCSANSTPFGVRTKQVVGSKLKPTLRRNER